MTVEELQVIITANTTDLRNEIAKTNKTISSLESTSQKTSKGIMSGFKFLKGSIIALGITKLVSMIIGSVDKAVARVDTLNNYGNVMSNLGVATADTDASIEKLSEGLVGLPTTLDDAVAGVQRFTSSNNNVKASTEMFLALNNAILSGNAPIDQQRSAMEQLSQAYAKGKPDIMEWRTAVSAMPAQMKQVAQSMGYVSSDQLGEALRSGKVSMNEFMLEIMKLNKEGVNGFQSFEDQAKNSTGGIATSIANMKTAVTRGVADVINAIGQSNIAGFFQFITRAINTATTYVVAFTKVTMQAIGMVSALFGGGKKQADDMSKSVGKAGSGMSSLGGSSNKTSKDMNKTTGSAKKLKKELMGLASFDEMNVLKEPQTNTGGSGGGAGADADLGGNLDLSGMEFDWDTTNKGMSKADQLAQKMGKSLDKLVDIGKNLWDTNLVKSFVGVTTSGLNAVKDFAVSTGTALKENLGTTWGNIEGNMRQGVDNMSGLMVSLFDQTSATIDEFAPQITDKFVNLFNTIWGTALDPFVTNVSEMWADFTGILVSLWDKHGKDLLTNIGEFVSGTVGLFQSIYDNVLAPIIEPLLEGMSWLWDKHVKQVVESVGDMVLKLVNGGLEIWNKFINPVATWLMEVLAPVWARLSGTIIGVLQTVSAFIWDFVGVIARAFGGVIDFVTGIFTGNWRKAWQGVSDIIGSIFDGIVAIVKFPLNLIIDGINGFIRGLNKIQIPKWVPGVGGKGLDLPTIPKLAKGGLIDRPTLAVVGEQGKEAVMPLENNTGWINKLAGDIAGAMGGTKGSDQPIHLTVNVGGNTLIDQVIEGANRKAFEQNEEVFNI